MKLTNILDRTTRYNPDGPAVTFDEKTWTWRQFSERVRRLGGLLKTLGVGEDDRIAVLSLNSSRFMEAFYGPFYAGAVLVPLNYRWALREMIVCMQDCTPTVLLVDDEHVEHARSIKEACGFCRHLIYIGGGEVPQGFLDYETRLSDTQPCDLAERGGEDLAALFYTGGTTGRPKGVMLTHANLFVNALGVVAAYRYDSGGNFLQAAPIFHLAAGSRVYSLAMANAHSVLLSKFDAEDALRSIEKYKVTDGLLIPTMINMMFNVPSFDDYDLTSLRRISYGAAPMPEPLLRRIVAKLPSVDFYHGYGTTEASPLLTVLQPDAHDPDGPLADKFTSVGKPVYHCEIKIVDADDTEVPTGQVGELVVRGPNIMKGYWNLPELTAEALRGGWYHTGDAGYFDEDGYVFLVDRVKDMIVSGGENVYSSEVENALHEHPSVNECAVIGIPHDKWGEVVHAIVTLIEGKSVDEGDLIAFCQERIARYKCPKSVEVIDLMPMSGANKVLKTELRKPYWKGRKSGVV